MPAKARICIVTHELAGLTSANGLGAAMSTLARALGNASHEVTLLFAGTPQAELAPARDSYGRQGVDLQVLPEGQPGLFLGAGPAVKGWRIFDWVERRHQEKAFHVVHFPDAFGLGAMCAAACRAGAGLRGAQVVIGAHGPMPWIREGERLSNSTLDQTVEEHLEREGVRYADAIVSPSRFLLRYLAERGWDLPARQLVQQNCLEPTLGEGGSHAGGAAREAVSGGVPEISFFGRLVRLKGLELFCDALDGLAEAGCRSDLEISFIGRSDTISGVGSVDYITQRARHWPWRVAVHTELGQAQALSYLLAKKSLAVIPSLVENSPNTVCEVLAAGIPFLAANTGGISELIHPEDRARTVFAIGEAGGPRLPPSRQEYAVRAEHQPLAARLAEAVRQRPRPARFAIDPAANVAGHVAWYAALADGPQGAGSQAVVPAQADLILDGRQPLPVAAWEKAARDFSTVTVLLGGEQPVPAGMGEHWRIARAARDRPGFWQAAEATSSPVLVVASPGLSPSAVPGASAAWLARLGADALALPVVLLDREGKSRIALPCPGVPSAALLGPSFEPGATVLSRRAVERFGRGAVARDDLVVRDLVARMAIAGGRVAVLPAVAGARAETEGERVCRELAVPSTATATAADLTDLLVPWRQAVPPALSDLPGQLAALSAELAVARRVAAAEGAARQRLEGVVAQMEQSARTLAGAASAGPAA